jgi:hypothetical protein
MKLETDYPFVCRLICGDLGVDDGWIDGKLMGNTLGEQVWTCDLRSIAQTTSNQEALNGARQACVGVGFRLLGGPAA